MKYRTDDVHKEGRGCSSYKQQYRSTYYQFFFFITNESDVVHPLAVQPLLCGLLILYTFHGHYGYARSRRRASSRRGEDPLAYSYDTRAAVAA